MKRDHITKLLLLFSMFLSGLSVSAQGVIVYKSNGSKIEIPYAEFDSIVTYEAKTPEQPTDTNIAEAIDLGLPSGVKWASWNLGATSPEEYGDYYAWGEVEPKENYSKSTYKYFDDTWQEFVSIGSDISGTEYDAAHVNWGDGWRMPTKAEIQELIDKCTWEWISYNGTVKGYKVIGPNGNKIFLPAAGYYYGATLNGAGSYGYYWSSTEYGSSYSYELDFHSDNHGINYYGGRYYGQSVRPVRN